MRCDDLSARATLLGVVGWPPCPAVLMAQGIPLQRAPRHGRRPPTAAPSRCFAAATGGSCRPIATHASSRAPAHYNSNTAASLPPLAVDASLQPSACGQHERCLRRQPTAPALPAERPRMMAWSTSPPRPPRSLTLRLYAPSPVQLSFN